MIGQTIIALPRFTLAQGVPKKLSRINVDEIRTPHSLSSPAGKMPRLSARNVIVLVNIVLLTALLIHLKDVFWDRAASGASLFGGDDEEWDYGNVDDRDAVLGLNGIKSDNDFRSKEGKKLQVNGAVASSLVGQQKEKKKRTTAVVVASQASENATWIAEAFPQWQQNVYRVDDPKAELTVPKNKGRESMVYLTYVYMLSLKRQAQAHSAAISMSWRSANIGISATSSTTTTPSPTTSSSSTQTATNGTTTTPTTTASPCCDASNSPSSRSKATSISAARGRSAVPPRSSRWPKKASTERPCMPVETIRRRS